MAAHITAAPPGGPRFDPALSAEQRRAPGNGMWLCQNCAKKVDNDLTRYTEAALREWKAKAEAAAYALVGKASSSVVSTGLRIELPDLNPVGHQSVGGAVHALWSLKVRLSLKGDQVLSIVKQSVVEDGVGEWPIVEIFAEHTGRSMPRPIRVDPAVEFWIRARSPVTLTSKPTAVGRMTFRFQDHTGEVHEHHVDEPPVRP